MSCYVDESVQIYNECNFIKFIWTAGVEVGRVEYFSKKNLSISQINTTEFSIRDGVHLLTLKYTEIDTTQPTDHATMDQLIKKLVNWICLEDKADPADTSIDSFGRQRVSNCVNLFHSQFRYDHQPLLFNIKTSSTNAGTPTVAQSINPSPAVYLDTTTTGVAAANDDKALFQTKAYMPYQADSTIYVVVGATLRTALAVDFNVARLGYYDDATDKDVSADIGGSGVYFEMKANGSVYAVIRNFISGTQSENEVVQTDWNLDQMDGTGSSGENIDFTKPQLYCFEIEQGSSRIRLGFNINGGIVWAHQFITYNITDESQLFNYSLPIRAELINSATSSDVQGAAEMKVYSVSADLCGNINSSDNALQSNPFNYCIHSVPDCALTLMDINDHRPLVAIRLEPTKSRASIWPTQIDVILEVGVIVLWRLILNPGGMTPTWQSVSPNSFAQYSISDQNVTITSSGVTNSSVVLACGYISTTVSRDISNVFKNMGLHSSIDGVNPDVLALTVEYVRGNCKIRGAISWVETK